MWQALSASFSITQKLDYVIETALYFYTFTTDIATLLLKFLTALLLLYYFGWRTASAFYLGANIFGSGVIFYYFFKFLFFFLQHCVADSIYTSGLILAVFLLHELNLISVPRILAYCTRKVVAFLHRSCDVTGDGKFDYQDVAVLGGRVVQTASRVASKVSDLSPNIRRRKTVDSRASSSSAGSTSEGEGGNTSSSSNDDDLLAREKNCFSTKNCGAGPVGGATGAFSSSTMVLGMGGSASASSSASSSDEADRSRVGDAPLPKSPSSSTKKKSKLCFA